MSYILDALKKSEQERGTGSIPSVQTIHSSSLNYHQEKRPLWPWILIVVLIANVSILIYFLKPEPNTQDSVNDNIITAPEKIAITPPVAVVQEVIETKIEPTIETAVQAEIISEPVNTVNETTQQISTQIVDIDELPIEIRRQIPNMVFSAHVFSSDAVQRSLVINNRFLEEGDSIDQNLILLEITANGAIFDFLGYRFSTSVLSGWGTP